jgi:hypothetical protein
MPDNDFGDLRKIGASAAEAILSGSLEIECKATTDRTFEWDYPEQISQEWIDDQVLKAHLAAPLWSDYVLLNDRPDIWELAAHATHLMDDRFALPSDDSFVTASVDAIEMLITISTVPHGPKPLYQVGVHCFTLEDEPFFYLAFLRQRLIDYGVVAFPDCDLILDHGVSRIGQGFANYAADPRRSRPIFVFRRATHLGHRAKQYQKITRRLYSAFGAVVVNDSLFRRFSDGLSNRNWGHIAIAPDGQVYALERDPGRYVPSALSEMLDGMERLAELDPVVPREDPARAVELAWSPEKLPSVRQEDVRTLADAIRKRFETLLANFAPGLDGDPPEAGDVTTAAVAEVPLDPVPRPRIIELDADGYPVHAADIPEWADRNIRSSVVILNRARKVLAKSRHPNPARIARALELLGDCKLGAYRGDRSRNEAFEEGLSVLRMRDGFSNADYLKGQTGDAYLVEHEGRKLLLERHLCSLSSGFNDPKMIRIYYVFDKISQRLVVGWLPTHLPTTQS